jgi:deoxycytidylate deaminase
MAVHAEMNAFLQLTSTSELTAYITVTPCFECAKVICNSNVTRIVASGAYKHVNVTDAMFNLAGIKVDVYADN